MDGRSMTDNEPAKRLGSPPDWMSQRGKLAWESIADGLGDRVFAIDGFAFALMCMAYATAEDAAEDLANRGPLIQSRDRGMVKNPSLQVLRDAGSTFRAFAEQFGLTPGARRRLGIDLSDEFDTGLID